MRLAFCILAITIYLISFNLYVLNITNPYYLPETKKLWYSYTTALLLSFYTVDSWNGYKTWMHEQISRLSIIVVICNFILIILTHHGILGSPVVQIVVYNVLWLIISVLVFISAWKNSLFK